MGWIDNSGHPFSPSLLSQVAQGLANNSAFFQAPQGRMHYFRMVITWGFLMGFVCCSRSWWKRKHQLFIFSSSFSQYVTGTTKLPQQPCKGQLFTDISDVIPLSPWFTYCPTLVWNKQFFYLPKHCSWVTEDGTWNGAGMNVHDTALMSMTA